MSQLRENIAIIGRAFSGTAIAEDLHLQFEHLGIRNQTVTYFGPKDVGIAYRAEDPSLILNRPVTTMNAFDGSWADYARHLGRLHENGDIDAAYDNQSFPPRSTFGSLILATNESHDERYAEQGNTLHRVESFVSGVHKEANGTYTLELSDGTQRGGFTKVVNATGHEVVRDNQLAGHQKVVSPYVDSNWEQRIKVAAGALTRHGGEVVLVGGGGTSLDAGVLAAYDSNATLRIFSEYGDISHHFFAGVSASKEITKTIQSHLDAFFDGVAGIREDKAAIGAHIRALIAQLEAVNPRVATGNGHNQYPASYIYPQFVLAELLADKRIRIPENDLVLKGVIGFNGNPIAPERQKLWEKLKADKRIEIETKRVSIERNGAYAVWLHVEGEDAPRHFEGLVIRSDEIRRGAVLEQGVPVNPALGSQFTSGLNGVSATDKRVLPIFSAQDPNIINVGAATYADANSVKVFRVGTEAAAIQIAAAISGRIEAANLIKLLDQRRKDGGHPIRILDVREVSENADVEVLSHPSLDIRRLPFKSVVRSDGFTQAQAQAVLPNDGIPTVVLCAGGIRSAETILRIKEFGYTNLINAEGGISALIPEIKNLAQLDYFAGAGIEKNHPLIASGASAAAVDPCGGGHLTAIRPAKRERVVAGPQLIA